MSPGVGADVESLCSKCGDVWHVVVAKLGDAIVKVQCKQCGGVHRPKPLPGSPAAKSARKTKSDSPARAAPVRAASQSRSPAPPIVLTIDPSKPIRPYAPSQAYAPGEQLSHPTFGNGVVEAVPAPGKMRVVFGDAARILVMAREGHSLAPPTNRLPVPQVDDEEEEA